VRFASFIGALNHVIKRMTLPPKFITILCLAQVFFVTAGAAADAIFSGPQPGEKTTGFKVIDIGGAVDGTERDPIQENAGAPTVLVFVHTVERSLVPLLRVIDQYGVERKERIKAEVIFLAADRLSGEQRVRAVNGSLKLSARAGLSPDGAEGPGNFGLNKECMLTIVMAKENVVTANFALVQPGITDAPKVIAALARTCGDAEPPSVEALTAKQSGPARGRGEMREMAKRPPLDLTSLDLRSEEGLRNSVAALKAEVETLRRELAAARGEPAPKPKEDFPGAVPTDAKLVGLLREFVRPTNDNATVDRVLREVKAHIAGNADLQKQALDGWTRVLHFGDRYGTAYSRKLGQEFLDGLKTP
jgi:hypothetical protein